VHSSNKQTKCKSFVAGCCFGELAMQHSYNQAKEVVFHSGPGYFIEQDRQIRPSFLCCTTWKNTKIYEQITDLRAGIFEAMVVTLAEVVQKEHAVFKPADSRVVLEINMGKWQRSRAFHFKASVDSSFYAEVISKYNGTTDLAKLQAAQATQTPFVTRSGGDVIASFNELKVEISEPYLVLHIDGLLHENVRTVKEIVVWADRIFLCSVPGYAVAMQYDLAFPERGFNVVLILDIEDYGSIVRRLSPESISPEHAQELIKKFSYKEKTKVYNSKKDYTPVPRT